VSLLRQLEVIRGDQVARLEGVDAACASDVEKNAAAEDRRDGLSAEFGEPAGVRMSGVTRTPPNISISTVWWQSASMWVPECSCIVIVPDALVRTRSPSCSWCRWSV
jgi:hypothetical protein